MLKKLIGVLATIMILGLISCGEGNKASLLDDISGVWKAKGEKALMTIQYSDKKIRLLFNDIFIPVTVGDIDEKNRTVNFNVQLNTGKPGVWTIHQIWDDKEKTSFHLGITLHDGNQEEFSFVRKVSTDDLNRLASLQPKPEPTASSASAQQAAAPAPAIAPVPALPPPVPEPTQPQPLAAAQPVAVPVGSFAPSFDCAKASTGPERLICSNQELSALDVQLMQAYKQLLNDIPDKISLKKEQSEWRKSQRDACSTVDCIGKEYKSRIEDLESTKQYLNKPAQFR